MRSSLAVVLLLASACTLTRAASPSTPDRPATVRTSGEGRVTAKPDLATVTIGVETLAKALPDAVRDADTRARAVLAAVAQAGVPDRDVRTTRYDVAAERRYEQNAPPQTVGWRVTHELRVATRGGDAARAGAVLDAALRAGANVVHSISFEKEDPAPERARALEQAVAAARAKAEAIARATGRALGRARSVAEASAGGPVPLARVAFAKEQGAPIQSGELEIVAQVEVEFELE